VMAISLSAKCLPQHHHLLHHHRGEQEFYGQSLWLAGWLIKYGRSHRHRSLFSLFPPLLEADANVLCAIMLRIFARGAAADVAADADADADRTIPPALRLGKGKGNEREWEWVGNVEPHRPRNVVVVISRALESRSRTNWPR